MAGRMPQFPAIVGVSRSRKGLISSVADERADLVRVFLYLHIVSADQGARPSGLGVMPDILCQGAFEVGLGGASTSAVLRKAFMV
jgi:hypothetical protein